MKFRYRMVSVCVTVIGFDFYECQKHMDRRYGIWFGCFRVTEIIPPSLFLRFLCIFVLRSQIIAEHILIALIVYYFIFDTCRLHACHFHPLLHLCFCCPCRSIILLLSIHFGFPVHTRTLSDFFPFLLIFVHFFFCFWFLYSIDIRWWRQWQRRWWMMI